MRITLRWAVVLAGLVVAGALAPAARAQIVVIRPVSTIRVDTAVTVPDGGSVTLGGYSQMSESRTEAGVPVLGRVPYASRLFRNVAAGRSALSIRVSASVRIIDLREEEERQTGVRSR
jgi:type II secretory pathway component GspD/PulD (secretin)